MELAFQRVPGVVKTEVGYTQGTTSNPTYELVCEGKTGHVEAVKITFDPTAISFSELLDFYWDIIDPTAVNRQGADEGSQYRTGIYFCSENQKKIAFQSRDVLQKSLSSPIATEIISANNSKWYRAEAMHQQYLEKGGQCALTGNRTPIRCYGTTLSWCNYLHFFAI